ncbi:hypothetical protein Tco_0233298 [Tanacetum coccineum]
MNTTSRESDSKTDERIDKLADQLSTLVEIVSKKVVTPAPVKAVEETCVTCGGAHSCDALLKKLPKKLGDPDKFLIPFTFSVEEIVPVLRESEDTSRSDSENVLPSCDDLSSINVPLLEDIECKDSYDSNLDESTFLVTPLFNSNKDECLAPGDDIEFLLHHDPSTPLKSVASILKGFINEPPFEENDDLFDLELSHGLYPLDVRCLCGNFIFKSPENSHTIIESLPTSNTLIEDSDSNREEIDIFSGPDDSIPPGIESDFDSKEDIFDNLLNDDPIPEYECLTFDMEPDVPVLNNVDKLNEDECFDPGGGEINVEVDDSFTFEIRIFLLYLTYPEVSPLLSSTENEDTIFYHGIFAFHFSFQEPVVAFDRKRDAFSIVNTCYHSLEVLEYEDWTGAVTDINEDGFCFIWSSLLVVPYSLLRDSVSQVVGSKRFSAGSVLVGFCPSKCFWGLLGRYRAAGAVCGCHDGGGNGLTKTSLITHLRDRHCNGEAQAITKHSLLNDLVVFERAELDHVDGLSTRWVYFVSSCKFVFEGLLVLPLFLLKTFCPRSNLECKSANKRQHQEESITNAIRSWGVPGGSLQLVRETLAESVSPMLDRDEEDLDLSERNLKQSKRKICDGHYTTVIHLFDHYQLIASQDLVLVRIKSFPRGTSCGLGGYACQLPLWFCLSGVDVAISESGLSHHTSGASFLVGNVHEVGIVHCSAPLTSLVKPDGGIRPIVVGTVWRCLVSKVSAIRVVHYLDGYLDDLQFGVGVSGGGEAILHALNRLVKDRGDEVALSMLLVDFQNAFNLVDRKVMLEEVRLLCHAISWWVEFCYSSPARLY